MIKKKEVYNHVLRFKQPEKLLVVRILNGDECVGRWGKLCRQWFLSTTFSLK